MFSLKCELNCRSEFYSLSKGQADVAVGQVNLMLLYRVF